MRNKVNDEIPKNKKIGSVIPNVEFIIKSGNAKFSDDGKSIEGNGKVTIEIDYDDNPNYKGEAVRSITIKGVTWHKEKKHHGGETHIVDLGSTPTTTSTNKDVYEGGLVSGTVKDGVTYEAVSYTHLTLPTKA